MSRSTFVLWAWLALYAICVGLAFIVYKDNWTAIQTWAVVLTGGVIIWYTWETKRLRDAAFAQRELQLRPFVVLELQEKNFVLTNVGLGVAVNIEIDEITVDKELDITVRFSASITILRPGEAVKVDGESFKKGKPAGDFFLAHLNKEYANTEIEVRVEIKKPGDEKLFCF